MARYRKTENGWSRTSGGSGDAINIDYDNSQSGLKATNVQDAIDEQKQELTKFADEGYVAKNLIPHPYAYNFPYTYNGITFDEIGGGCLRLNGTNANSNNFCNFTSTVMQGAWADKLVDGKTYCYSVEFVSGSGTISAYINNGQKDLLSMKSFTGTNRGTFVYEKGSELTVAFYIPTNQTVNNLVIRPMIVEVDAKGNYPTRYTMYAPSNTDLGSDVTSLKGKIHENYIKADDLNSAMIDTSGNLVVYKNGAAFWSSNSQNNVNIQQSSRNAIQDEINSNLNLYKLDTSKVKFLNDCKSIEFEAVPNQWLDINFYITEGRHHYKFRIMYGSKDFQLYYYDGTNYNLIWN